MSKFKVGDKVKVIKSAKDYANTPEFTSGWYDYMDKEIGFYFVVSIVSKKGINGKGTQYFWPEQSLELVEDFKEQKTYSVQQVLQATDDMYDTGMMAYIEEIEKYLENRQDPEWKEYLLLKEKFED